MKWKGKKVTIGNYSEIFKGYSKDIVDVIRSAVLDDTPLEPYIKRFSRNPYLLWQVKLALDEELDNFWFEVITDGDILYKIRNLRNKGINIEPLKKYITVDLSSKYKNYILSWYEMGVALNKYDFSILPEDLLEVFNIGIEKGFPMYIFNNGVQFSKEYLLCCIKILSNRGTGSSVAKFLNGEWDIGVMRLLSKYSGSSRYYSTLIEYVTSDITPSILEELYNCCRAGMSLSDVAILDSNGLYVYSSSQLMMIREAYVNNWDYKRLLNPELSINDARGILNELELYSKRKISGRLVKKD